MKKPSSYIISVHVSVSTLCLCIIATKLSNSIEKPSS